MPDLVYNVKFQIDSSEVERVQGKLSQATTKGTTGKSGIAKQAEDDAKSLNELLNEFKLINKEVDNQTRSLRAAAAGNNLFSESAEESALTLSSLRERLIGVADNLEIMADSSKMSAGEQLRIKTVLGDVITTYDRAGQAIDKFSNAQEQASQTVKQSSAAKLISEYSLLGKEVENTARKLVTESKSFSVFNAATDASARSVESLAQELMSAIAPLEAVANSTESTIQEKIKARTTINQLMTTYQRSSKTLQQYAANQRMVAEASEVVQQESKRMNSSFSSTNQLLFSFSDGIQDASQFSYGFATGMRAVGNNIGFTAELFGNLNTRINEYNTANAAAITSGQMMAKTMRSELMGALKGPGGIILALNVALTAITMVSKAFGDYSKKASEAAGSTNGISDSVYDLAERSLSFLTDESLKATSQIEILRKIVEENTFQYGKAIQATNDLGLAQRSFATASADATSAMQAEAVQVAKTNSEIDFLARVEEKAAKDRRDAVVSVIREKLAEAEANKLMNDTLRDIDPQLAVYQDRLQSLSGLTLRQGTLQLELASGMDLTSDSAQKLSDAIYAEIAGLSLLNITQAQRNQLLTSYLSILKDLSKQHARERPEIEAQNDIFEARKSDFMNFVQIEEAKRREARETARLRIQYERIFVNENSKVYSEFNSIREAFLGRNDEDQAELNEKRIDSMKLLFDASSQFSNSLMQLGQAQTAENEAQARRQFETNKKLAYASAVVNGAAAVVDIYRSQKGEIVAKTIAAGLVAAAVGVQIAKISQQQFESGGGGVGSEGGASAGFGFQMNEIQGAQTFRAPAFMPSSPSTAPIVETKVEILADRRNLFAIVKRGEEEMNGNQVQ